MVRCASCSSVTCMPLGPRTIQPRHAGGKLWSCLIKSERRRCSAGDERKLEVRGLFYGIGHTPNSSLIEGQVDLDDKGYIKVCALILLL